MTACLVATRTTHTLPAANGSAAPFHENEVGPATVGPAPLRRERDAVAQHLGGAAAGEHDVGGARAGGVAVVAGHHLHVLEHHRGGTVLVAARVDVRRPVGATAPTGAAGATTRTRSSPTGTSSWRSVHRRAAGRERAEREPDVVRRDAAARPPQQRGGVGDDVVRPAPAALPPVAGAAAVHADVDQRRLAEPGVGVRRGAGVGEGHRAVAGQDARVRDPAAAHRPDLGRHPGGEDRVQPGQAALDRLDVDDVGGAEADPRPRRGGVVDLHREHRAVGHRQPGEQRGPHRRGHRAGGVGRHLRARGGGARRTGWALPARAPSSTRPARRRRRGRRPAPAVGTAGRAGRSRRRR